VAVCGALLIASGLRSAPPRPAPLPIHAFVGSAAVAPQGTSRSTGCRLRIAASRLVVPSLCVAGRVVPVRTDAGGAVV